jgi:two-component system LytT family response regulator
VTPDLLRVLVVDDDPLARGRLCALLAEHADVVVAGECADGRAAVDAIRATTVDLVLLDVQMPGLDGFEVLAELAGEPLPLVVFTSAYSEFAVRAFEAYAIDYLLKPFDEERLARALDRAREQAAARGAVRAASALSPADAPAESDARLAGLLEHMQRREVARYPEAIAVKSGNQYVVVRVGEVDWIEADGNYARLYVQRRPRLLAKSLTTLERDVLDPAVFVRVHRSAIVNVTKIAAVEPLFHGEVTLVLHDGTRVDCSRRSRKRLEERLYFTS